MQTTSISPPRVRPDAIRAIPANDTAHAAHAISEAPSAFDPATWLDEFETVGGGYVVTNRLSLCMMVEGRTDEELSRARLMIVTLSESDRSALVAHIREREG